MNLAGVRSAQPVPASLSRPQSILHNHIEASRILIIYTFILCGSSGASWTHKHTVRYRPGFFSRNPRASTPDFGESVPVPPGSNKL